MRISRIVAVVGATVFVAAACGGASTGGNNGPALAGKRLGVSMCCQVGLLDQFVANIKAAAEFTGRGATVTAVNAQGDPAKQLTQVETFIAQHFDAVMTTEQSDAGWADLVTKAHQNHIIFTNHSAPPDAGADLNIVYPHYQSGYMNGVDAGKWLQTNLNGVGAAGISITTDNAGLRMRSQGFEDGLKSVVANVKIYEGAANKGDDADGAKVGANLLQAHPDIKIFFGWNEPVALGMLTAATEAGRKDPKTFYIGTPDASPTAFQKILDGTPMQSVAAPNFSFTTTLWEFLTEKALLGQKIPHTGVIGVVLVNKDNAQAQIDSQTKPLDPQFHDQLYKGLTLYWQDTTDNMHLPTGDGIPVDQFWGSPAKP
jgi:ABC-type sugar transport system substrate-binding protein